MVKNLKIYILFFRVPKKGMSGLPYLLKPWSTFFGFYGKSMTILCKNVWCIRISLLPFYHSEMHCEGFVAKESSFRNVPTGRYVSQGLVRLYDFSWYIYWFLYCVRSWLNTFHPSKWPGESALYADGSQNVDTWG